MTREMAKRTLYFYMIKKTASSWEKGFFDLYGMSGETDRFKLSVVYPELAGAIKEYLAVGDSYFDEFRG